MTREGAKLDPLATDAWTYLGSYFNAVGQLGAARAALRKALEISPEHFIALEELGLNHLLEGEPAGALSVFQRSPQPLRRLLGVALSQHDLGRATEAQQALDEMVERSAYKSAFQIAEVHAWRGEPDRAFEWLERSHAQRDPGLRRIKYDPRLQKLRGGDPRYTAMLREMDLPLGK
jgi:tetratricopeptide (TPR) repeat protein